MSTPNDPSRKERREAARAQRKAEEERQARKKRLGILGGITGLAVVVVVVLLAVSSPGGDTKPVATAGETVAGQTSTAALLKGIPQQGRFLGSPDAPVTLVEFADLQCPFCQQYSEQALPTVIDKYVGTGKVRLEFRPRTFIGRDSEKAAKVVVAAGRQNKLWNTLEILYANQGKEGSGWVTDDLLTKALQAAGADPAKAKSAAESTGVAADIKEADLRATRNGLNSTPSFLLGKTGAKPSPVQVKELSGAYFSQVLDRALSS